MLKKRFENISIDGCFSSDLTRTSLTARSVYVPKGLPLRRDPRFREVGVGIWEDVPVGYLDYFEEEKMRCFNHNPPAWQVPGSEVFEGYTQRFLEGLRWAAEEFDGGSIAVFSHGLVTRGALMRLFFGDDPEKLPFGDNTAVCKLSFRHGEFSYEYLNDNSHIPPALSTYAVQRWWRETNNRKESGLYFLPLEEAPLPRELTLPATDGEGVAYAAMLRGRAVGAVCLGRAREGVGQILGMTLLPEYEGRFYGDQLLGCAFSHFRKLGCGSLEAAPGDYPDGILERYEFNPETRRRSIDTKAFYWE